MKDNQISMLDLLCEIHVGLERQGPGSTDTTIKALSFINNLDKIERVADLGCGSGGQTMVLAQNITGRITGVDLFPDFVNAFNKNAKKHSIQDRVKSIVGSMDNLSFQKEEFDLIWSEGAIDNIGFEKGLSYWHNYIKNDGYVAVTCPSWFTDSRPSEIEKWWTDAGCDLNTIGNNILIMQKVGYVPIATFTIPEICWTDNYFKPREKATKTLMEKYYGNKTVAEFVENNRHEVELYSKYKQYFGYAFYIGKKINK